METNVSDGKSLPILIKERADRDVILQLTDSKEIEIWKKLMFSEEGVKNEEFVCPKCGKLQNRDNIIPIIISPKHPEKEILTMNVCVASCPDCSFPLHKEYAIWGYPFNSVREYISAMKNKRG